MKILLADSGSTKTEWCMIEQDSEGRVAKRVTVHTQGINPVHQDERQVTEIIEQELLPSLGRDAECPTDVFFYGAGCGEMGCELMTTVLRQCLLGAKGRVEVASDLLAAARALCGRHEGVAAILGTGANSCYYDGCDITMNVPPLGYILGDEGSGAVLGKLLVNALLKGDLPQEMLKEFYEETQTDYLYIINKVYRQPLANRFLASLAPFVAAHRHVDAVRKLVVDNFTDFIRKNVAKYDRADLPVNAVGSIAYYFRDELAEALENEGLSLGTVVRAPMEGLVEYHAGKP